MCGKSVQTEESCIRPTARMQLSVSGRWRFAFAPVSAFELDASVFRFSVRPFVSFVSHIVRYASSLTDKSASQRKPIQPIF